MVIEAGATTATSVAPTPTVPAAAPPASTARTGVVPSPLPLPLPRPSPLRPLPASRCRHRIPPASHCRRRPRLDSARPPSASHRFDHERPPARRQPTRSHSLSSETRMLWRSWRRLRPPPCLHRVFSTQRAQFRLSRGRPRPCSRAPCVEHLSGSPRTLGRPKARPAGVWPLPAPPSRGSPTRSQASPRRTRPVDRPHGERGRGVAGAPP